MLSINQFPGQSILPFWVLQEGSSEENQYNQPGYEEYYEKFAYMQNHSHLSLKTGSTNRMT